MRKSRALSARRTVSSISQSRAGRSPFAAAVSAAAAKIPRGKVATYATIAEAIGQPRAERAVGNALNRNDRAPVIPCHRVIRSDGSVGGYALGQPMKIALLRREGVAIASGRIDLAKYSVKWI
jgi:O-6-methylguanine DNA methyltransferase